MTDSGLTAPEIRAITERGSGLQTVGVVEKIEKGGEVAYQLRTFDRALLCMPGEDGWSVAVSNENNQLLGFWRDRPDEGTRAGEPLLQALFGGGQPLQVVFRRQFVEKAGEVYRKIYDSALGEIRLHSRSHPEGSEGVIELPAQGVILRYVWERKLGGMDVDQMERLDKVPF